MTRFFNERYQILSQLGSGENATVYLAHDLSHQQTPVAIKTPVNWDEIRLHKKVSGMSHVPRYLGHFSVPEQNHQEHLVMQYIEGKTLECYEASLKTLPLHHFFAIGRQLFTTLHLFAEQHVVFNDVHSRNILIDTEGTVFLVDLGQAFEISIRRPGKPEYDLRYALDVLDQLSYHVEYLSPMYRQLSSLFQGAFREERDQKSLSSQQILAWWKILQNRCNGVTEEAHV